MNNTEADIPQRETHHIALNASIIGLEEVTRRLTSLRDKIESGNIPIQVEPKNAKEIPVLSLGNILVDSPKEINIQVESMIALINDIENRLF